MEERERLVEESAMFGSLSPEARAFVAHHLEAVNLPGGAHLMREGDVGDSLFFVAVGRLRVTMTREDGTETLLAELGRGEVVGELAVMTNEPRTANVTALRDSQVLELSGDAFTSLVAQFPEALRGITTQVVRRLVRSLREGSPTSPVVTIAVVPLSADPSATGFAARLRGALERLTGAASNVTSAETADALGDLSRVGGDRLASWFAERELGFEAVVYAADPEPTDWTAACVRQADLVLLVGSAVEGPSVRAVERESEARRSTVRARTELVLVHPSHTRDPRGTRGMAARPHR